MTIDIKKEREYWQGKFITQLQTNEVFVFGSNPQARHFAGAAKAALKFGAKPIKRKRNSSEVLEEGIGRGLSGQSYALVTKNLEAGYTEPVTGIKYEKEGYQSVTRYQIEQNIFDLYTTARENPDKNFLIAYNYDTWPNGSPKKSLNGYTSMEILDMFVSSQQVPDNIVFHESFKPVIDMKLEGITNAGIVKRMAMGNIKKAYDQAEKEGTIQTSTINANGEQTQKFTYFWLTYSPFSQWHPSNFEYNDVKFTSAEQFMMYCKAKLFSDENIAQQIMDINTEVIIKRDKDGNEISRRDSVVKQFAEGKITREELFGNKDLIDEWNGYQKKIKAFGRKVQGYNEEIWVDKREKMVSVGSREKYNQNPDLKEKLMQTGNTTLVEASPWDKIWGIGLKKDDPRAKDPNQWQGLNLLGKILTNLKLRYQLQEQNKNTTKKKVKP